ncbi:unnamed protein product [Lactuca saligna]|uniref:Uncharacterized protein n=1 Tax=Lactuca saligna TaxID=75948 RepID=A0AA35VIQ8_LACSI|nr:unnamed protein product [Lactuca saligna]
MLPFPLPYSVIPPPLSFVLSHSRRIGLSHTLQYDHLFLLLPLNSLSESISTPLSATHHRYHNHHQNQVSDTHSSAAMPLHHRPIRHSSVIGGEISRIIPTRFKVPSNSPGTHTNIEHQLSISFWSLKHLTTIDKCPLSEI